VSRVALIVVNLLAYDLCWAALMFGAGRAWWPGAVALTAASVAGQLAVSPVRRREAMVVLGGALVGVSSDALGVWAGVFAYNAGMGVEFWIVFFALWANFGTVLRPSLSWMWDRLWMAALLGAGGGPLAYWLGAKIGAISLGESPAFALAWIGVQYGLLTPAWMWAARRVIPRGVRGGRREEGSAG
jgi:hypothetical protein